jgi:hypothetical protein
MYSIMGRSHQFTLQLSEAEFRAAKAAAELERVSLASLVRRLLAAHVHRTADATARESVRLAEGTDRKLGSESAGLRFTEAPRSGAASDRAKSPKPKGATR